MDVLKLLYLVRYVDDVKANLDNIVILMADDIRLDKIIMREQVRGSLDRLMSQNYIQFKFSCLLLVVTDNVLHGFRKLCHITLFHIFTDLHRIFQRLIIRCIGKHNNCLPGGFRHQPEFSFFHSIRGHGKDTQTHS